MIQSNFFWKNLYNTCCFGQSEFLKFQYVFPSSEISKFCVILGTAGFYDIVANKNVLSQLRWLDIPYLVSLEASMKYITCTLASIFLSWLSIFLICKCFLSFYELRKIFKVYAYFAYLETLDITIIKSSSIKNNQVTFNANKMVFCFVFARAQIDFVNKKMRN